MYCSGRLGYCGCCLVFWVVLFVFCSIRFFLVFFLFCGPFLFHFFCSSDETQGSPGRPPQTASLPTYLDLVKLVARVNPLGSEVSKE